MSVIQAVSAADSESTQRRVAGALRAANVRPGDRVALCLSGSTDYLGVVLGATRSGVVPVPLDPRLTSYEQDAIIADVEPALIIDGAETLRQLVDGDEDALAPYPL